MSDANQRCRKSQRRFAFRRAIRESVSLFWNYCPTAQLSRQASPELAVAATASGSLVLREALAISRGLEIETDDTQALQDWLLWRRVLDHGWVARKQKGFYLYRRHGQSMSATWQPWELNPAEYFHRAALSAETITLFIPLSGRETFWPDMATFLDRQTWPRDQTRLILMDTSQNAGFSRLIRRWVANCDYADVRHIRESVGPAGLADMPRKEAAAEVCRAMARIYTRLAKEASTGFVWVVEDDISPPLDACDSLLRGFDRQTASVTAAYRLRFNGNYAAWNSPERPLSDPGAGLQTIGGNGFGCVILRSEVLRDAPLTASIDFPGYDVALYYRLPQMGLAAKIDWRVVCRHQQIEAMPKLHPVS